MRGKASLKESFPLTSFKEIVRRGGRSMVERRIYEKKIKPLSFKVFERKGVWGKEKLFLKSFLSPTL